MQINESQKRLSLLKSISFSSNKILAANFFNIPKLVHIETDLSLNQCTFALRHKNTPISINRHTPILRTYFTYKCAILYMKCYFIYKSSTF